MLFSTFGLNVQYTLQQRPDHGHFHSPRAISITSSGQEQLRRGFLGVWISSEDLDKNFVISENRKAHIGLHPVFGRLKRSQDTISLLKLSGCTSMADSRQPEDSVPQWDPSGGQEPGGPLGANGYPSSVYRTTAPYSTRENGFNGELTGLRL
ncbi:hypothetical protein OJAV_G00206110 [Oryzias javanicus]|uniref:Uncharacterized protein n=1 Tax=Oryzias javanicus TaxID=123683 RepID=A0A3S2NSC8_ORYJA|nr:hypothetical protein OJAV_G00206110 [Oryzias javanicus]